MGSHSLGLLLSFVHPEHQTQLSIQRRHTGLRNVLTYDIGKGGGKLDHQVKNPKQVPKRRRECTILVQGGRAVPDLSLILNGQKKGVKGQKT